MRYISIIGFLVIAFASGSGSRSQNHMASDPNQSDDEAGRFDKAMLVFGKFIEDFIENLHEVSLEPGSDPKELKLGELINLMHQAFDPTRTKSRTPVSSADDNAAHNFREVMERFAAFAEEYKRLPFKGMITPENGWENLKVGETMTLIAGLGEY
jgi:hypothetical protein